MSASTLHDVLCVRNTHERDQNISFQEEGHKYTIHNDLESKYTSVTTWNHEHFPKFDSDKVIDQMMNGRNWNPENKYWGMTKEEIKKMWSDNSSAVSGAGTEMHYEIECFMNNPVLSSYTHKELLAHYRQGKGDGDDDDTAKTIEARDSVEWEYFMKFVEETPDLNPYRTEWTVYDEELKLSGSIDMVYENPDGTLMIYDWKRSKSITKINTYDKFALTHCISHLPDSNFWHYSLQLNTYKAILERKYGKKVTDLKLVRLHPNCKDDNDDTYELIDVPDMSKEVAKLFELRRSELYGDAFTIYTKNKQTSSIKT